MINKIVYSFWKAPLEKRWQEFTNGLDFEDFLTSSLNCLTLSLLSAKKFGFEIEVYTDAESEYLFRGLPIDSISKELSFLKYSGNSWIDGKIYAISRQTKPFIHLDWDVVLQKEQVVNRMRNFTSDILVQNIDLIDYGSVEHRGDKINYSNLWVLRTKMDYSKLLVEGISNSYDYFYNTAVIGFNNLDFKDKLIEEYLKCLSIIQDDKLIDYSRIIDQYVTYSVAQVYGASCETLFGDVENMHKHAREIGYTHLTYLSKYTKPIQQSIKKKINEEFPEYSFLVKKQQNPSNKHVRISLCTPIKNRIQHVKNVLPYNLEAVKKFNGLIDINIFDYNSTDGLEEYLFKQKWFVDALDSGIIKYYKNYEAEYYHRSLPKCIIHYLSSGEYLINADCDNYLSYDFLTYCMSLISSEQDFFARPEMGSAEGAYGRIMVSRKDFEEIGGYNTNFSNYGFEDTEFLLRLKKKELNQILIPKELCQHIIEHGNELRIGLEKPRRKLKFDDPLMDSDYENKKGELQLNTHQKEAEDVEIIHFDKTGKRKLFFNTGRRSFSEETLYEEMQIEYLKK